MLSISYVIDHVHISDILSLLLLLLLLQLYVLHELLITFSFSYQHTTGFQHFIDNVEIHPLLHYHQWRVGLVCCGV
jgi:hypothetical protein